MSFAYLPLYTGDYLRDTRHLTPLRHGIYLLALMYCWDSKGPMPLDEQECAGICNCRSADEIDGLRYILKRFFVLMDDGWYNKRMADEVARSERISNARSESGMRGAEARRDKARKEFRDKKIKQEPSNCQASAKHVLVSPSPSPSLSSAPSQDQPKEGEPPQTPRPKPAKAKPKAQDPDVIPPGVDPQAWEDFAAHRREIRKPMTPMSATKNANILRTLTQAQQRESVNNTIANGWTGVFPPKNGRGRGLEIDQATGLQTGVAEWLRRQTDVDMGDINAIEGTFRHEND